MGSPIIPLYTSPLTSTPQLPFKIPQIPSNRDYKAPSRGTLGGLGSELQIGLIQGNPHKVSLWLQVYK